MKIHELEELLGVSKATIRHYEDQGLVIPARTENKYRDYNDDEVLLLQKILVMRKLGVSIPEIKELIEGRAELHDVLDRNVDKLRTQQKVIASAIEMCGELGSEAADFDSIDSPRYLRQIYEEEQKGAHFVEAKEISARQLNLAITLLGALAGVPVPQNKLFSEHSNEPLPADIRGNKKEGDEYATIGNVLEKGGKLRIVLIAAVAIFIVLAVFNGLSAWGGLGFGVKFALDFNKSGISHADLSSDELAKIADIDPEAEEAYNRSELLKFHTKGDMQLSVKRSDSGEWTEIDRKSVDAKEGYMFVTGNPSSNIEVHIITDGRTERYSTEISDDTYRKKDTCQKVLDGQIGLHKAGDQAVMLFLRDENAWPEATDDMNIFFGDILEETPPDGCYAVAVQDAG